MSDPLLRELLQERLGVSLARSRRGHLCARVEPTAEQIRALGAEVARHEVHPGGFFNVWLSPAALTGVLERVLEAGPGRLPVDPAQVAVVPGAGEWDKFRARVVKRALDNLVGTSGPGEVLALGPTSADGPGGPARAMELLALMCSPARECRLRYLDAWDRDPYERLDYALARLERLPPGKVGDLDGGEELLLLLEAYPWERQAAARHRRPDTLARYAVELADAFHPYYARTPLLAEPAGLALCRGVAVVLEAVLFDLGF